MEPVSLTIGMAVTALVLKAAETAGEKGVESGWGAVSRLVERLRSYFRDHGDAEGVAALVRVQDPPAGEPQLAALAATIDRRAVQDPTLAQDLRDLVQEAESGGVKVQQVSQAAWGNQNVQIADVTSSSVSVNIGRLKK